MKIYIDVSMIMIGTNFTGIPRVVMELVSRLYHRENFDFKFIEYDLKKDAYRLLDSNLFAEFCKVKSGNRNKIRTDNFVGFDEFEKDSIFFDIDTVWKTRVRRSYLYPLLRKNGVKVIPFIHDIIGIDYPQFCDNNDIINFIDYIGSAFIYSNEIIVTSNTTKKSIEAQGAKIGVNLPPISIIPLGGDFSKIKKGSDKSDAESDVREKIKNIASSGNYLLMVGTIEPRKNHKLLLNAYEQFLKGKINVVFAGYSGQGMEEFFEKLTSCPEYSKGIWHVDDASDDEIDYLYRKCFAMAFPSYIEGYGLPIIEALIRGVPVIAADNDINREIAGERALFFEQDNPEDLSKIVIELIENKDKYKAFVDGIQGYVPKTWDETGEMLIQKFKEL